MSITAPQDAHKLVLEVVEWLTASLVMMILGQQGRLELGLNWSISSTTAPQDLHKLVLKVVEWLTASLVMMMILGQQGRLELRLNWSILSYS